MTVHQDLNLYIGLLAGDEQISYHVGSDSPRERLLLGQTLRYRQRSVWLHVAQGEVTIDNRVLTAGDAVAYPGDSDLQLSSSSSGEILLFDLA